MKRYTGGDTMEGNMARQDDDCIQRRGTISLLNKHTDHRGHRMNQLKLLHVVKYRLTLGMYKVYIHRNFQIGSIFQQVDSTIADCGSVLFVFLCNHDAYFTKTYNRYFQRIQRQHFFITCNTVDIVIHFTRGLVIGVDTVYLGYYATYYNIGSIALY